MSTVRLDPAPRSYAPSVSLLRRATGGPSTAPATTTVEEIEAWLFTDALREDDQLALFESLVSSAENRALGLTHSDGQIGWAGASKSFKKKQGKVSPKHREELSASAPVHSSGRNAGLKTTSHR